MENRVEAMELPEEQRKLNAKLENANKCTNVPEKSIGRYLIIHAQITIGMATLETAFSPKETANS